MTPADNAAEVEVVADAAIALFEELVNYGLDVSNEALAVIRSAIAGTKAKAWDEGYGTGQSSHRLLATFPNPYREATP